MRRHLSERMEQRNRNIVLLFFICFIALLLTGWFAIASQASGRKLIPLSVLSLILGVLFEGKRVSQKWSTVFGITLTALIFSMIGFLPGKGEHDYQITSHIEIWPYWFIGIFSLIAIVALGDKVVPQFTEGITLLQSIALAYWVIDYGFFNIDNYFLKVFIGIGAILSLYSIFHAFTYSTLTKGGRLTLSLWSSLIMLLFAMDNVYRVYQNEQIENTADISHGAYIALQFFLLGISAIYMIQNFTMLMRFLPGRGTLFNAQYFRDVRELKDDHIKRYSDKQVSIGYSLLCVIFATVVFGANYYYQIVPRHLAIWIVFVIFPFVIGMFNYATGMNRYSYEE